MSSIRWLVASCAFLVNACTRDLDGLPCPCDESKGYVCCASDQICYKPAEESCASSSGGTSSGGTSSGGAGHVSGGKTAASGSAGSSRGSEAGGSAGSSGGSEAGASTGASGGSEGGASAGSSGAAQGGVPGAGGTTGTPPETGGTGESGGTTGEAGAGGLPPTEDPVFALVATQHNDNGRTGANLEETALRTSNVNSTDFGELSRRPLRGAVYAQPLVAPQVPMPDGSARDVVYVATMSNMVYALDAQHPERTPLWSRDLGSSIVLPDPEPPLAVGDAGIWHEIGIVGTPVLSPKEGALYLVTATKTDTTYAHTVHKLDFSTGASLATQKIQQSGFANASQLQRSGLTLAGDVLYVAFGGYNRNAIASGWVFAFDQRLTPLARIKLGGPSEGWISMNGQGPAADDAGALYFSTNLGANPPADATYDARLFELYLDAGELQTFERLYPPASAAAGNELGAAGPLLIPQSNRVLLAGQHLAYVLNRSSSAGDPLLQEFRPSGSANCAPSSTKCEGMPSSPVFWPGSGEAPEPRVFIWSPIDRLRAFRFDPGSGRVDCTSTTDTCESLLASPADTGQDILGNAAFDAAQLSVSSHGAESGSGIVWAVQAYLYPSARNLDGILRAFDAQDLNKRIPWNTEMQGVPPLGPVAPGATPTVSGGRVFVGTSDGLSRKFVFWDDWTDVAPAIANLGDENLVIAWRSLSTDNPGFQLSWSADGRQFDSRSSLYDKSQTSEPALVGDDASRLFLAWSTLSSRSIQVVMSDDPGFTNPVPLQQRSLTGALEPLQLQTTAAPALAYGSGRLFLAWANDDEIHVVTSTDGIAFDLSTELTLVGDSSLAAPALRHADGKLELVSTDDTGKLRLFTLPDGAAEFEAPIELWMRSPGHPALLATDSHAGKNASDLHLVWADSAWADPNDGHTVYGHILAASAEPGEAGAMGSFARRHQFEDDAAPDSISATKYRGAWFIAWRGAPNQNHPNVARFSPGELVTYGLLH